MNQLRSAFFFVANNLIQWFSWVRYQFNRSFSSDSKISFLLLAISTLTLILIGAQSSHLGLFSQDSLSAEGIDNQYGGGWIDSYWWSIKHVLDPGAFAENYGAPLSVLIFSLLLSLGGLVFLGALIGLISASIQQQLEQLELGNTQVVEKNHVVILGWGPSSLDLIRNLISIHAHAIIVILAPCELSFMREELRREGIAINAAKLVLRKGIPSRSFDLDRISVRNAASINIVAHSLDVEQNRDFYNSPSDAEAIKTLLVLESLLQLHQCSNPNNKYPPFKSKKPISLVCEICSKENIEIAKIASSGQASIVSTADFASRLLVQAARQPGIIDVFECILNQDLKGIRVQSMPEAVGKQFSSLFAYTQLAVPIGVSWLEDRGRSKRTASALNLEPSYEIEDGEDIVLLSQVDPVFIHRSPEINKHKRLSSTDHSRSPSSGHHFDSVLIIGANALLDEILVELNGHALSRTTVVLVSDRSNDQLAIGDQRLFPKLDFVSQQGSTLNRSLLTDLIYSDFDCIFILADESFGDADARSIMTLLMLGDIVRHRQDLPVPRVVLELKDSRNRDLVKNSIASEIVVSSDLVSTVMAQTSRYPVVGPVYRELLSAGGIQISFRTPDYFNISNQKILHSELIAVALQKFETVIGMMLSTQNGVELVLAPDIASVWELTDDDTIVVLSQQIYD